MFKLVRLFLAVVVLLFASTPVLASLQSDLSQNQARQDQLEALINSAKSQENTLSGQIATFNNEIELAQLKVDSAQARLDSLTNSIASLTASIASLQVKEVRLAELALARFRVTQAIESARPPAAEIVTGDFASDSTGYAYQTYVQYKDKVVFKDLVATRKDLAQEKSDLSVQQSQATQARDQLASAKADLDNQKAAKVQLLEATQNSENKYQAMLAAAKREAAQIILAYNNKGGSRWVTRGEPIGTEGCTGYCFGPHLHFALYPGTIGSSNSLNPCLILSCQVQGDGGYVRSGRYLVPMKVSGANYANVSQWWGMTWFARLGGYGGGPHTGVDMYTYQGDLIHAASDGVAYFYRGGQTNGNGVFIYHPDGYVTLYWHLN